jgi:hypothetical protein
MGAISSKWVSRRDTIQLLVFTPRWSKCGGFVNPDFQRHCEIVYAKQLIEKGATTIFLMLKLI